MTGMTASEVIKKTSNMTTLELTMADMTTLQVNGNEHARMRPKRHRRPKPNTLLSLTSLMSQSGKALYETA